MHDPSASGLFSYRTTVQHPKLCASGSATCTARAERAVQQAHLIHFVTGVCNVRLLISLVADTNRSNIQHTMPHHDISPPYPHRKAAICQTSNCTIKTSKHSIAICPTNPPGPQSLEKQLSLVRNVTEFNKSQLLVGKWHQNQKVD